MQKVTLAERQAAWDKMVAMMTEWMQDTDDGHRNDESGGAEVQERTSSGPFA